MNLILRWVVGSAALFATVWILSLFGLAKLEAGHWFSWGVAGLVMGFINALIAPLLRLITAPLNCCTVGIAGVLVNGLLFFLIGAISQSIGFPVFETGFLGSVLGAILVSAMIGGASNLLFKDHEEEDEGRL